MKKSACYCLLTLGFVLLFATCKTTDDDYESDLGLEYFPLEVGKFIVYEVDSTIYDPTGDSMVIFSKSFAREEVVDTLLDNLGNTLYRVERYIRQADTLPWQIQKVLTISVQGNQAVRTEDNLRFVKMTFPLRENDSWNGLVHFDPLFTVQVAGESIDMFKGWGYRLGAVGEPDTIGGFAFGAVATLQEADSENLIELRISREKYAKDIGLVYREQWILDTQCIEQCEGQTWEEKAEKGYILKQTILSHN